MCSPPPLCHTLLVGDKTQALKNASFSSDMSLAVYFLLPREKTLLYVTRLNQEAMKTTLEGVRDQFIADFRQWYRSPSNSAFWLAIYRRNIFRKYIFMYKEQFLFYSISFVAFDFDCTIRTVRVYSTVNLIIKCTLLYSNVCSVLYTMQNIRILQYAWISTFCPIYHYLAQRLQKINKSPPTPISLLSFDALS